MKSHNILFMIAAAVQITACTSTRKTIPAVPAVVDSLPALPLSEIDIPVKIYAPPVLRRADQIVSKEFTSEAWPNYIQPSCDFRYKYRFIRSGFSLQCTNNSLGVEFTGNYQVAGSRCLCTLGKPVTPWLSGSCGFGQEPMRKVALTINARIHWLPDYQIRSNTRLTGMTTADKCQVSLFSNDVTEQVLDSIRSTLNGYCAALDSTLAGFNVSGYLKKLRDISSTKTDLGKFGFFQLDPKAIRLGQLTLAKDTFSISAGISCRPSLSSDSSFEGSFQGLPPLQEVENRNHISLYLNMAYDYAFISRRLDDTLRNKVFEWKGKSVLIRRVEMKGLPNHQIEVAVDFAGSNQGSIFLRGRPVLDTARQSMTIQDISYSLESRDLMLKLAKTFFRNKIKKTIEGNSYLDIGALVNANMPALNAMMVLPSAGFYRTSGSVRELKLLGILARQDKLLLQIYMGAEMSILVPSLP